MFLDVLFGLILGIISSLIFGTQDSIFFILLFGVFCSLVPDIDFIIYFFQKKFKIDHFAHEHRDLLHKPIFFIITGIALLFHSPEIGIIWIVGTLYHFIHDTIDGGWGIMWLYPFSKKYYTLASYSTKKVFRNKEEQREFASRYGDPDWFKKETAINKKLILKISLVFAIITFSVLIL